MIAHKVFSIALGPILGEKQASTVQSTCQKIEA